MSVVARRIEVTRPRLFEVLLDPRSYPVWLIGAQEIRSVDPDWPLPGSRFHHRVGLAGPLTVADSTVLLEAEPPYLIVLEVRARPLGRGKVTFRLRGPDEGPVDLEIEEVPIGAAALLRPVLDPLSKVRNERSLGKLADLVEGSR